MQCNGLGRHRDATQTHAGSQGATGNNAFAQIAVLRSEPNSIAKGRGVLHGALQPLRIGNGVLCLRKTNAPSLCQLDHRGQHLTLKTACQCAQGINIGQVQPLGTKLQHLDQAWLIKHRLGVWQTHHAGDTPRYRGS